MNSHSMLAKATPLGRGLWTALALASILALQACGGSGGDGIASSSALQLANGVVTGFGSVFVDGVEIEDASASVQVEGPDGSFKNTVLQMGQRVRVNHDGKGTASKVTVDAAVIGQVSAINGSEFTVAAQLVKTISDSTLGSVTMWGGDYADASSMTAGDWVEVHGTPVYDATSSSYQVVATRVQKLSALNHVQVRGQISGLDTVAHTFMLNGLTVNYTSATLRPATASLSNGLSVVAYADPTGVVGTTLTASNIKLDRLKDNATVSTTAQLSGLISRYDATTQTFEIQGVKVNVGSASIQPSGAVLADGAYVKLDGTVGSDGGLTASRIQVRQQDTATALAAVKLIGVISDFVDNASFVVRGVPVDASQVTSVCSGVSLANGVEVTVQAKQQSGTPVVLATSVECKAQAKVMIRPVDGTVASVGSDQTLVLTLANASTQTIQWNANTTFVGLTADALAGQSVRVEGYVSNNVLVARVVMLSTDTQHAQGPKLDDSDFRTPRNGTGAVSAWQRYRNRGGH